MVGCPAARGDRCAGDLAREVVAGLAGGLGGIRCVAADLDPLLAGGRAESADGGGRSRLVGHGECDRHGATAQHSQRLCGSGRHTIDPNGAAATQWLVSAHADLAAVAGLEFVPAMDITVLATGDRWPELIPGEQIQVGGLVGPDLYSVLPGVVLKARAGPVALQPAPLVAACGGVGPPPSAGQCLRSSRGPERPAAGTCRRQYRRDIACAAGRCEGHRTDPSTGGVRGRFAPSAVLRCCCSGGSAREPRRAEQPWCCWLWWCWSGRVPPCCGPR